MEPAYSKVPLHENDEESTGGTAKPSILRAKYPLSWFIGVYLATVFLAAFLIVSNSSKISGQCQTPSEMYLPVIIPRIPTRFHGSPHFEANGTAWREAVEPSAEWPESKAYFGDSGTKIDDAWNHLIRPRYFSVSENEAKQAWGAEYTKYRDPLFGGYTAGYI
ncbi:hypothetical protein N7493_011861 [Penicillium malachiteum]|uniref:Uncharacterized protein n=1 Tax=Penicillium malachiteum TaxID=1324776 RepID=A0AAD6HAJ9_9EURO|nr:hypothetical protein N7493_011861 [Penicillium malachiteum]